MANWLSAPWKSTVTYITDRLIELAVE